MQFKKVYITWMAPWIMFLPIIVFFFFSSENPYKSNDDNLSPIHWGPNLAHCQKLHTTIHIDESPQLQYLVMQQMWSGKLSLSY
jgi:hypothetical protein